jgi:hypothetical protein
MRTPLAIGLFLFGIALGFGLGWMIPDSPPEAPADSVVSTPAPEPAPGTAPVCPPSAPCPDCPPPAPCPAAPAGAAAPGEARACAPCPAPGPCAECPAKATLCADREDAIRELTRTVRDTEARLAEAQQRLTKRGPAGRYDDPTAQGRRAQAAAQDNLLLEIPSWGDDYALPPKVAEKHQLSPADQAALEEAYQEFQRTLYADLRELLVELTGDPAAGENATLNALVHDILGLSPRPLCRERMLAITAALAAGTSLPPAAADAPACEQAILALYGAVDQLDAAVRDALGDPGAAALWSGTSTFEFSTRGRGGEDSPEP